MLFIFQSVPNTYYRQPTLLRLIIASLLPLCYYHCPCTQDGTWSTDDIQTFNLHETKYNLHEPKYNLHEPKYYLHEPKYNLHEPEYNLHAPKYNLHEPEYNLHEPEYKLHGKMCLGQADQNSTYVELFVLHCTVNWCQPSLSIVKQSCLADCDVMYIKIE